MSILWGDPASASALAATLRRTAARLATDAQTVSERLRDAEPGWTGPQAVRTRRDVERVVADTARLAATMDEVGRRLQSHATDLADTIARLHHLEEEGAAAGLEVRDGTVRVPWGITGAVGPTGGDDVAARAGHLRDRLHVTLSVLGRQRADLAHHCREAARVLSDG